MQGGFQIRHREHGVFQGEWNGLSFWNLLSNTPGLGFREFESEEKAKDYARVLCSLSGDVKEEDLTVEPFDLKFSKKLKIHGIALDGIGNA